MYLDISSAEAQLGQVHATNQSHTLVLTQQFYMVSVGRVQTSYIQDVVGVTPLGLAA